MPRLLQKIALCIISTLTFSCAYHFQGSKNPLKEIGVEKIYIASFQNSTFRPGLEQLFSTAMIREFQKYRNFQIVNTIDQADAVLTGNVSEAESSKNNVKTFDIGKQINVASEFVASVTCAVELTDRFGKVIFSQNSSSSKIYSGSLRDRPDDGGATVPLTNESEQRIAIQFLASQMMASVYQRMIDTF